MIRKLLLLPVVAAFGLFGFAEPVPAQDDLSRAEYLNSCASCHGEMGKGGGEVAKYLTVPVPDLTQLSANNDGVFPMLDVIHIIDGRTGKRGHDSQMPMWGANFRDLATDRVGFFGAEAIVRGRILSLAYYLEAIQE